MNLYCSACKKTLDDSNFSKLVNGNFRKQCDRHMARVAELLKTRDDREFKPRTPNEIDGEAYSLAVTEWVNR